MAAIPSVQRAGESMKYDQFIHGRARFFAALIAVVLVWVFTIAAMIPAEPSQESGSPEWVRTADGWQRPDWREPRPLEPGLHPVLPALGIALLSVFWLIAFSDFEQPARAHCAAAGKIPPPHARTARQHVRR